MSSGGFEFAEGSAPYTGSGFGIDWGPLTYRFAGASSAAGDRVLLSSLAFGDVLIGRAFAFGAEWHEHYFVFGSMIDDAPETEEEELLPEGVDAGAVESDAPTNGASAAEPSVDEATVDAVRSQLDFE